MVENRNSTSRELGAGHARQGAGLARQGLVREAEAEFRKALACDPALFDAQFGIGALLLRQQRYEEATEHLNAAAALRPDAPEAHEALALALARLGRNGDAITSLERCIALRPDNEVLADRLVSLLFAEQRGADAATALENLAARRPDLAYLPRMRAKVLSSLGRLDEAQQAVRQAMAIEPGRGADYYLLMDLTNFTPGDIADMEAQLNRAMPAPEAAELRFALAKAYRDAGEPQRGFDMLCQANHAMRSSIAYDERRELAFMTRIAEVFTPDLLRRFAGAGDPTEVPVFILGMPRSGTTLIEQILASHPNVIGAGETGLVTNMVRQHVPDFPDGVRTMTGEKLQAFASAYRSVFRSVGAERITDKTLDNARFAGLLHLAFPRARFIWVVRDPVDNCLACFSRRFMKGVDFTYDLAELGRFYRAYEKLMRHWDGLFPPGTLMTVRYEDVVADLKGRSRALVAHCGLDWDDACLSFHTNPRPVFTASAAQVRAPISRSAIGRWRPPDDQLKPLLEALG